MRGATAHPHLRTGRSLWADSPGLSLPSKRLSQPLDVDVVVIGAGISGAFMAYDLSHDFHVAVLECNAPLLGSTIASTAMLQWELDSPALALAEQIGLADASRVYQRSRRVVNDLIDIVRLERIACRLTPKASLYLAGDAYGARALKSEAKLRTNIGLDSVFLRKDELRERFAIERSGAILSQGSASADPAQLAAGLLRRAIKRGAHLFAPEEVTGIMQGGDHVTLVNGSGFEVRARHIVFCCGYAFPKGVPTNRAKIISTWALASKPIGDMPEWLSKHLLWEASDPYLYVRTTTDGRIIMGGEDEASADRQSDPIILKEKGRTLTRKLKVLLPNIHFEIDYAWAGAFGHSTTSMPLIGAIPDMPNCHAVMGLGGNGITFSALASQIVGATVRGRRDPDADLFAFT
ncbi:FAD dependent oxidoreductase [Magnetospirillum fulvum MGU-K5]|uniref:FAD dependent oxidoreductase n=2 Tax=Magnetospirillum fulvum TaxID=1082 RepID=S9TKH0_MAGFU|nr:FAD dependent oxidoreductase [Magnetospirillum fulvum MGU-K5]